MILVDSLGSFWMNSWFANKMSINTLQFPSFLPMFCASAPSFLCEIVVLLFPLYWSTLASCLWEKVCVWLNTSLFLHVLGLTCLTCLWFIHGPETPQTLKLDASTFWNILQPSCTNQNAQCSHCYCPTCDCDRNNDRSSIVCVAQHASTSHQCPALLRPDG